MPGKLRYKIIIFVLFAFSHALSQIYIDDTVFIGNNDGSPFHVPCQGVVDIPVWVNEIFEGENGAIVLTTPDYAVSERLDGNFHFPWTYAFWPPVYHGDYTSQSLWFTAVNPPDSVGHFADFSIRMDIDSSFINDTLNIMNATAQFCDSTGYILYFYGLIVSQIIIDDITSIDETELKPENIAISYVYPNPFNAQTTIEYSLSEPSDVTIEIYDLLGRKVETLVDEKSPAGRHQVVWDASEYSSGVYLYRIKTQNFVEAKRMILLR